MLRCINLDIIDLSYLLVCRTLYTRNLQQLHKTIYLFNQSYIEFIGYIINMCKSSSS